MNELTCINCIFYFQSRTSGRNTKANVEERSIEQVKDIHNLVYQSGRQSKAFFHQLVGLFVRMSLGMRNDWLCPTILSGERCSRLGLSFLRLGTTSVETFFVIAYAGENTFQYSTGKSTRRIENFSRKIIDYLN